VIEVFGVPHHAIQSVVFIYTSTSISTEGQTVPRTNRVRALGYVVLGGTKTKTARWIWSKRYFRNCFRRWVRGMNLKIRRTLLRVEKKPGVGCLVVMIILYSATWGNATSVSWLIIEDLTDAS
jgi:hypothetical protein